MFICFGILKLSYMIFLTVRSNLIDIYGTAKFVICFSLASVLLRINLKLMVSGWYAKVIQLA
jgi:hypothetical protein